jgi:hypothetical protein
VGPKDEPLLRKILALLHVLVLFSMFVCMCCWFPGKGEDLIATTAGAKVKNR